LPARRAYVTFREVVDATGPGNTMTDELFRKDSYLRECDAAVVAVEGRSV